MEIEDEGASEEADEVKSEDAESSEGLGDEIEEDEDQMATEPLSYKEEFQRAELEKQQAAVSGSIAPFVFPQRN
jgi:hypothetical protein